MIKRASGVSSGYLCINILEGRISFRSKRLVISQVRKGYVIGVSSSLQIVIDPNCHAVAFRCGTNSESISIAAKADDLLLKLSVVLRRPHNQGILSA